MHHIIYLSQATVPFNDAQLQHLLTRARAFNETHQVTEMLLYGNDQFLQVLEGEEATVQHLYAHISQDPRHRDVITYADKAITKRAFTDWSMAFQALPPQQLIRFSAYISPAEVELARANLSQPDTLLLQLLRSFMLLCCPRGAEPRTGVGWVALLPRSLGPAGSGLARGASGDLLHLAPCYLPCFGWPTWP